MSVLPRSHQLTLSHDETYDPSNLLTRGQHINDINIEDTVAMALRPGQASFHNVATAHGSGHERPRPGHDGLPRPIGRDATANRVQRR